MTENEKYKQLYDDLLREAQRDGFKRREGVFIFVVYGAPDMSEVPARCPALGYIQMDSPYQGEAMAEARKRFAGTQYVYLDEMRGAFRNTDYVRYVREHEPHVYNAWVGAAA